MTYVDSFCKYLVKVFNYKRFGPNSIQELSRKIIKMQQSKSPSQTPQFSWSPRLRHSDLTHSCNRLFRDAFTHANDADFTAICAITKQQLSSPAQSLFRWSLKVNKVKNYLYAGICLKKFVIDHRFLMWPWGDLPHGHYVLGSQYEVYTQSDEEVNFQKQGFGYITKDVVWCEYDSGRNRFTMVKNQGEGWYTFEMTMPAPGLDVYVPCVYLVDVGDQVEIGPGRDIQQLVAKAKILKAQKQEAEKAQEQAKEEQNEQKEEGQNEKSQEENTEQ